MVAKGRHETTIMAATRRFYVINFWLKYFYVIEPILQPFFLHFLSQTFTSWPSTEIGGSVSKWAVTFGISSTR